MSLMTIDPQPIPLMNGNGHINGENGFNGASTGPKYASGLILPPPEIKCMFLFHSFMYVL